MGGVDDVWHALVIGVGTTRTRTEGHGVEGEVTHRAQYLGDSWVARGRGGKCASYDPPMY